VGESIRADGVDVLAVGGAGCCVARARRSGLLGVGLPRSLLFRYDLGDPTSATVLVGSPCA
jgi:hypothetical protein